MSITYLFLMGGALASMVKNYGKFKPNTRSFIVDYDMIIVTLPMSASGSLFGVILYLSLDSGKSLFIVAGHNNSLYNIANIPQHKHLPKNANYIYNCREQTQIKSDRQISIIKAYK